MLSLFYFAYRVQVYLRNELPQLRTLRTYLNPSIFDDPNKFPAKITIKHQLGVLRDIKEKLEDWELKIFQETCFRHFIYMDMHWMEGKQKNDKRNTFIGQYVYFLMLRRMKCSK